MRKLAFFVVGGAIWILLGATSASGDNGPHLSTVGQLTDRCAGCHRLHSAQAAYVLVEDEPALCYTCHGAGTTGASTDVQEGLGYTQNSSAGADTPRTGSPGALRGGGFQYALVNSHDSGLTWSANTSTSGNNTRIVKVAALDTGEPTTSAHSVNGSAQTAWGGGGTFSSTEDVGITGVQLTCTSCHDPHGGNDGSAPTFRILKNNPAGLASSGGAAASNTLAVKCTPTSSDPNSPDSTCTASSGANNVTCKAVRSTSGTNNRVQVQCTSNIYPSTASTRASAPAPSWPPVPTDAPAPNIQAVTDVDTKDYTSVNFWNVTQSGLIPSTFTTQMANWCSQCHTRYKATQGRTYAYNTGDAIFRYRHRSDSGSNPPTIDGSGNTTSSGASPNCIQCHLAHGSNSDTGSISGALENPGGGTAGLGPADNRLLRIDKRGTCAACHTK